MSGGARYDIQTKWPSGFDPVAWGAILVDCDAADPGRRRTVFISYAWVDSGPVLAIDQSLRNKGVVTKIDRRDFFLGGRIRAEILRVMRECHAVLVFYSA